MLTQVEADALIQMSKRLEERGTVQIVAPGGKASLAAESLDGREKFLLDMNRGRIKLTKYSYQERYRMREILARLCVDGSPHRNPDGQVIDGPHLHLYREDFGDKWAAPLPADAFSDVSNLAKTLRDFLSYCNFKDIPEIQASLQ